MLAPAHRDGIDIFLAIPSRDELRSITSQNEGRRQASWRSVGVGAAADLARVGGAGVGHAPWLAPRAVGRNAASGLVEQIVVETAHRGSRHLQFSDEILLDFLHLNSP